MSAQEAGGIPWLRIIAQIRVDRQVGGTGWSVARSVHSSRYGIELPNLSLAGGTVKKQIEQAYLEATGQWRGCSWHTKFGPDELNLCDISCSQAQLMARATCGNEAESWRNASRWLREVERDARRAENAASRAAKLCWEGNFQDAATYGKKAQHLEAKYRADGVWQSFSQLIDAAASAKVASNRI